MPDRGRSTRMTSSSLRTSNTNEWRSMMLENSYRFSVGAITCVAVSDGTFTYPSGVFVANVPVERFEQELRDRALPPHEVVSPYTCLYVDTGRHRVLIDIGAGFAPTNGKLLANLAAEGIAPEA